ncbi:TPA: glycosyltransferase [Vibrio vulnificus]|nr:glycosyltransferase [Vibrio vulnificus]HDY7687590.1 glycosyltransferase [Vibrio vulnificus]
MKNVIIVGGIPSPIGGVTSYISRLLTAFPEFFSELADLYPHKDKVYFDPSLEVKHNQFNGVGFKFFLFLLKSNQSIVHFNFSTIRSLMFFLLLPKKNKQKWLLTLHNGDPIGRFEHKFLGGLYNQCFIIALRKFDRIVCLNSNQESIYRRLKVNDDNLFFMDSFVPYTLIEESPESISIKDIFNHVEFEKTIIMNGYCKSFYNFHYAIEYVLSRDDSVLIIALYGDSDENYEKEVRQLIGGSNRVKILYNLEQAEFISLLSQCNVYLRANSIDSFGIAVADAVCLGLKVVASDVCERFSGAILYKHDSKEELFNELDSICLNCSKSVNFEKEDYLDLLLERYSALYEFND